MDEYRVPGAMSMLERLVRLLIVMNSAGSAGVDQKSLIKVAGFTGEPDDRRRKLSRDITELNAVGWDIQNVSTVGTKGRHVLRSRDTRLRVELTRDEQTELSRVARMEAGSVEPPDGDSSAALSMCSSAIARACRVQFRYKGTHRTVHPRIVTPGPSGWYVVGREDGQDVEKHFVIDRISDLHVEQPGTAERAAYAHRNQLDPATWEVDPPIEVRVGTAPEFAEQVENALGSALTRREDGDQAILVFGVTNRAAFRRRLYPLGTRVRVLGPDEIRQEIVDELTTLVDSS